jgi:hypothetical protein
MWMSQLRRQTAPVLLALALSACSQHEQPAAPNPTPASGVTPATLGSTAVPALDVQLISERLGTTPRALPGGALSVTLPRSGVSIKVEGSPAAGALNTELLFQPATEGAAVSGSVELLEDEVNPVLDTLLAHGIRVVGLYNRFLYDEPRVLVLRFEGQGNPALLASGVQSISSVLRDARLRSSQPLRELPGEAPQPGTLDAVALGSVLGVTATVSDGVVALELPRPAGAAPAIGTPSGPLLRASLSGSDLHAALSGTFVLAARELVGTLAALRTANVHLVGLVPQDTPGNTRWFALHFRGKNNSLALVRGLALALQARADAR